MQGKPTSRQVSMTQLGFRPQSNYKTPCPPPLMHNGRRSKVVEITYEAVDLLDVAGGKVPPNNVLDGLLDAMKDSRLITSSR